MSRFKSPVQAIARGAFRLALCSALWMAFVFEEAEGSARVYFGTDTRAAATLVDAALAALLVPGLRRWPAQSSRLADAGALAATGVLGWAWLFVEGAAPFVYRGGLFVFAVAAAAVIAGVVLAPRGIAARVLGVAPLRFMGVVSYGVYLWHWPLYLVLSPQRTGLEGAKLTAIRIAASLGVASLSYFALERPIRRSALRPRRLAMASAVGTALVVVGLLAGTNDFPKDFARGTADPALPISVIGTPDLVLVGDSVADKLGPALRERAAERGLNVAALGSFGCLVMDNDAIRGHDGQVTQLPACDRIRAQWRQVVARKSPGTVLIVEGGTGLGHRLIEKIWEQPCAPGYDRAFEADLTEAIRFFERHGARSAITTTPSPSLEHTFGRFRRLWGDVDDNSVMASLNERMSCQNELRHEVTRDTGALLVDLAEFVCPLGHCPRDVDGVLLRPDGVHYEGAGARVVADWLLDQLAERGLLRRSGP